MQFEESSSNREVRKLSLHITLKNTARNHAALSADQWKRAPGCLSKQDCSVRFLLRDLRAPPKGTSRIGVCFSQDVRSAPIRHGDA
jgi:hypothetical protein